MVVVSPEQRKSWDKMSCTPFDLLKSMKKGLVVNNQWRAMCRAYLPLHLSGKAIYKCLVCYTVSAEKDIEMENFVDYLRVQRKNRVTLHVIFTGACVMIGMRSISAMLIDCTGMDLVDIALPIAFIPSVVGISIFVYTCVLGHAITYKSKFYFQKVQNPKPSYAFLICCFTSLLYLEEDYFCFLNTLLAGPYQT